MYTRLASEILTNRVHSRRQRQLLILMRPLWISSLWWPVSWMRAHRPGAGLRRWVHRSGVADALDQAGRESAEPHRHRVSTHCDAQPSSNLAPLYSGLFGSTGSSCDDVPRPTATRIARIAPRVARAAARARDGRPLRSSEGHQRASRDVGTACSPNVSARPLAFTPSSATAWTNGRTLSRRRVVQSPR